MAEDFRAVEIWEDRPVETLADIPPREGGVLVVGINPSSVSVAAVHYYQGTLGRPLGSRTWPSLTRDMD